MIAFAWKLASSWALLGSCQAVGPPALRSYSSSAHWRNRDVQDSNHNACVAILGDNLNTFTSFGTWNLHCTRCDLIHFRLTHFAESW